MDLHSHQSFGSARMPGNFPNSLLEGKAAMFYRRLQKLIVKSDSKKIQNANILFVPCFGKSGFLLLPRKYINEDFLVILRQKPMRFMSCQTGIFLLQKKLEFAGFVFSNLGSVSPSNLPCLCWIPHFVSLTDGVWTIMTLLWTFHVS